MAAMQLTTLLATTDHGWNAGTQLLLPLLAGLAYYALGRRVLMATRQVYQLALTGLIAFFGLFLLLPT